MIFGRLKSCVEVSYLARGVTGCHCYRLNGSLYFVRGASDQKKQQRHCKRLEFCYETN